MHIQTEEAKEVGIQNMLSGVDGLIHNLEIYTGKIEPCPGKPDIKASGNIVLRLLSTTPRGV